MFNAGKIAGHLTGQLASSLRLTTLPLERAVLRYNRLGGYAHKATIAGNSPP